MIGRRAARAIGSLIAGAVAMSGCTSGMMRAPAEGVRRHTIVLAGHALAYCADVRAVFTRQCRWLDSLPPV